MLFNLKIENNLFDESLHYLTLLHLQEIYAIGAFPLDINK